MGKKKVKAFQIRGVIIRGNVEAYSDWNENWKKHLKDIITETVNKRMENLGEDCTIEISSLTEV
jgi:hypothetical protein